MHSVKWRPLLDTRTLKMAGVNTNCPKEARNSPFGNPGVTICSSAYATDGFSATREMGHVTATADLASAPAIGGDTVVEATIGGPSGGGSGDGGFWQAKAPVVLRSSLSTQCIDATDLVPSKPAKSCAIQPRPSAAVDEQR